MIAPSAIIHPGVRLGADVTVEDFCIIGAPFRGQAGEETVIGDGAVIRSHTVIYAGNVIGAGFQTGNKANIRELNRIGDDVSVGTLTVIEHHVTIGSGVRIHSQVFIPEFTELMDECWIGPNVVITNARYPKSPEAKQNLRGAVIEPNAKIGANCTLLPGVRVGAGSLVGAGSVVTKDVAPGIIAAGNPARRIKNIFY
ncbi:MAG TPA: DapH/DapD/GlmU-related protein [Spirochaetota bacterium]|nr:DapH/DapD/GlmU-related protein [Spirochaetota bacterium]HNT11403.1 DapH/DapD/GlmU-related protein [Spirochaetota bacterium]HNV46381.1 DapH/DapD/GlmU-related protein [Spirochaetota bacterium]HOS39683.1 DapH/DapD/GlmU-related protein [Spirochaetota bacterium]HPI22679.1 DapH/DapD/GlmU-related protein [Spirochaetota bacterium]